MTLEENLETSLNTAIASRKIPAYGVGDSALRLFNGFFEGYPDLCLDLFERTVLINQYQPASGQTLIPSLMEWIRSNLPFVDCVLLKKRFSPFPAERRGIFLFGDLPCQQIIENGVTYRLDLLMNHDSSFYLDTTNLRSWLLLNSKGKTVLNTFAYTGSLGIAALAGKASEVTQLDKNPRFLDVAKQSLALNRFDPTKMSVQVSDFFPAISRFKKYRQEFDVVILDPPFFSSTSAGKVDLNHGFINLINKVRPIIRHNGKLICINNALFVSGNDVMAGIDSISRDGYVHLDQVVEVDQNFIGYSAKPASTLPTDPSPFNHSTKIIILSITKKDL